MKQQLLTLICLSVVGMAHPAQAQIQDAGSSVGEFIGYIWERSPVMSEAKARVLAAAAGKKAASKWQYNPEIAFGVEDVDGEKKTKQFGVSQTIDWSGKFVSSGKVASFDLQAVQADYDQTRQNVALEVLSSLSNYRTAKNIFDLSLRRTDLMERFSALSKKGFAAGDIDQSEYNLAQLALSEALMVQADAEAMLANTKGDLSSSIGFSLGNQIALPKLPEILPNLPSSFDEDELLINLPHLRAIKSRENAADAMVNLASKNRFSDPTIGITGGKDTGSNMVGISISIPLNVINTYSAELDKAKSEAFAEAKAGQNAFYSAKIRLQAAQKSYRLSKKAWGNWQENGAHALGNQTDILDRKLKVGDLSATDYLVQIEQALDTQVAAEELRSKAWKSWVTWLGASGTVEKWIQNLGE